MNELSVPHSEMMKKQDHPQVGVGVIVLRNHEVLLGKRKGSHGAGSWSFPGGHLEYTETVEECAKREVQEEIGISIDNLRKGPYTNDIFANENRHYVTLFIIADYSGGEVRVMEPGKCEAWRWFAWDKLPQPLFLPIQNLRRENYCPF
jgi:8-oxo-dGTP diphosphatase